MALEASAKVELLEPNRPAVIGTGEATSGHHTPFR